MDRKSNKIMNRVFNDPSLSTLFSVFKNSDFHLRLVGGAVRDILLGIEPNDLDFCTDATPDEMIQIAIANNIKYVPTGLQHGTLTFVLNGENFEITTLRIDKDTDGRHATVEFTRSFKEDARRRDFTINAMSMDADGILYDYFGGAEHILSRTIEFVGNPLDRIQEDYLRVLRYFRFLGKITPAGQPVSFNTHYLKLFNTVDVRDGISSLSIERIWSEVVKIFNSPHKEEIFKNISHYTRIFADNKFNDFAQALDTYLYNFIDYTHLKSTFGVNDEELAMTLILLSISQRMTSDFSFFTKMFNQKIVKQIFDISRNEDSIYMTSAVGIKDSTIADMFITNYEYPLASNRVYWLAAFYVMMQEIYYDGTSTRPFIAIQTSNIIKNVEHFYKDIIELPQYKKVSKAEYFMSRGIKGRNISILNNIYNRMNAKAFSDSVINGTPFVPVDETKMLGFDITDKNVFGGQEHKVSWMFDNEQDDGFAIDLIENAVNELKEANIKFFIYQDKQPIHATIEYTFAFESEADMVAAKLITEDFIF